MQRTAQLLIAVLAVAFAMPAQADRLVELIASVGTSPELTGDTVPGRRAAEHGRLRALEDLPALLDEKHVPELLDRLRHEWNPAVWRLCVRAIDATRSTLADDWILSVAVWPNGKAIVRDGIRALARPDPEPDLVRAMRRLVETAPSPDARFDAIEAWATHSRAECMAALLQQEYGVTPDTVNRSILVGHMGRCGARDLVPFLREEFARAGDEALQASMLRALGRLDRKAARDEAWRVVRSANATGQFRRAALEELVVQGDRDVLPIVLAAEAPCSLRWWGCARMRDALDRMPVGDLAPTPGVAETLQKGVGPLLQVVWPKDAKPEDWEWFEQTRKPRCLSLLDLVEPVEYQLPHLEIVFLYEAAGIVADVPNWHPDWLLAWGRTEPEWTIVFGPRSQWLKEREELVAKLRAR